MPKAYLDTPTPNADLYQVVITVLYLRHNTEKYFTNAKVGITFILKKKNI